MSILETAKAHPAVTIAIVVIVGGGTLWALSRSGGDGAVAPSSAYDMSGTAFQDQLNASQQNSASLAAQLQAAAAHDTSSLEVAKLQLQAFNANEVTQQFKIANDTAATMQASTLNAAVQQASIDAMVKRDQIAGATQLSLAQTQAHSQDVLVSSLAGVQKMQIQANQAVATQSWWNKTFG